MRHVKNVKETVKRPYVHKALIINKQNISKFLRPEWHREFRERHVQTLTKSMMQGVHPSETITVNELYNGKMRILNGNHRIQAIKNIIANNPKFNIEITLTVYYNLNKEKEIEIYEKVNDTRRENAVDKLKAHLSGSRIYNMIEKNFPSKIVYRNISKGERNVIRATLLFPSYIHRNSKAISSASTCLIKRIKLLTEKDYDRISSFVSTFKDIVGEPSSENMFCKYNMFSVMAKIYYTNVGITLTRKEYVDRMKKIISTNTSDILMMNSGGIDKQQMLFKFIINKIKCRKKLINVLEE